MCAPKAGQENGGPSCPAASHVPLLFAPHICFFFSTASKISLSGIDELEKRNKERKIKKREKQELHFLPRAYTVWTATFVLMNPE